MITQPYYLRFLIIFSTLFLCDHSASVIAAITASGDVNPSDPSTWTNATTPYIGQISNGIVKVDAGSGILSNEAFIGYSSGRTGEVTVDGDGSTWTNSSQLVVGYYGNGTLKITGGGAVSDTEVSISSSLKSVGMVTVDGTNSKWTNSSILDVGLYGNGTLIITGGGAVSNTTGYIGYFSSSVGTVTVDGTNSKWTNSFYLEVGFSNKGTLKITGGGTVSDTSADIGYSLGSVGTATVDGIGSKWTNSSVLCVGWIGKGTLNITGGGTVSDTYGDIGFHSGSGTVMVDGNNSKWTNSSDLCVGNGMLHITGGGAVTAANTIINGKSLLAMDVGNGSLLTVNNGSGTITNSGTVRILAGAGATAGKAYTPISAGTWSGTGIYQAIGGKWNATDHTFTASFVQATFSTLMPITINLKDTQRVLAVLNSTQYGTGYGDLGVSFAPTTTDTLLDFNATPISGLPLTDLQTILNANNQTLLSGWQVTATGGYTTGDPAYLSFDVGAGRSANDITVWHYDGAAWSQYDTTDLTCNGGYASFTVTGFSGYALTAVPEPGTLILLASGFLIMLVYLQRRLINRRSVNTV
ncbi:MAG: PEP-CTERM sorting domain-containing protein [Thermoguttaceae bacterium]|jgi:T5SS/PEP-CTERM-associated repeat protein